MPKPAKASHDELRQEYDLAELQGGVRGKHYKQAKAGTNLILLDPDVAKVFPDAQAVNETLRAVAKIASRHADAL